LPGVEACGEAQLSSFFMRWTHTLTHVSYLFQYIHIGRSHLCCEFMLPDPRQQWYLLDKMYLFSHSQCAGHLHNKARGRVAVSVAGSRLHQELLGHLEIGSTLALMELDAFEQWGQKIEKLDSALISRLWLWLLSLLCLQWMCLLGWCMVYRHQRLQHMATELHCFFCIRGAAVLLSKVIALWTENT
jgi:hypothetical protein